MNWAVAIGVAVVVVVLGGVAARAWWKLAHKAAPYGDETARGPNAPREEEVIIISENEKRET